MASDVKVVIKTLKAAGKVGFGVPLILSTLQSTEVPFTTYSDIDEIEAKFGEESAIYKTAVLLFKQNDSPDKIGIYVSEKKATDALSDVWDEEWRQLIIPEFAEEGDDTIKAVSDYVEAKQDKLYFADISDLSIINDTMKNERTIAFYYDVSKTTVPNEAVTSPVAALAGASASKDAGSFTYKNLILKGLAPMSILDSEIDSIHKKNALTVVTKAGDYVTTEGKTLSGEYIDIVDSKDYVVKNIEYQVQKNMNSLDKLPYDDRGISQIESIVVNVLKSAYNNGIIANDENGVPDYSTKFKSRNEVDAGDRGERIYNGGSFTFGLAGAVHNAQINGEIII